MVYTTLAENRQITLPFDIVKSLSLKIGDKLAFRKSADGKYYIENANNLAIKEAQEEMAGVADELGLKTDDDVMNLIREVRYGEKATV